MLSGIGPAEHLRKFSIPVVSDLPVGKNLRDRVGLLMAYKMQASNETQPPMNPHVFPTPVTVGYKALKASQTYPDYQALNFIFPSSSSGFLMICSNILKYEDNICNKVFAESKGHELFGVAISNSHPESTGEVLLRNKDPLSDPIVKLGIFSNPKDVEDFAKYILDFTQIENTTHFKSVGAKFIDFNLWECRNKKKYTLEYWRCYAVAMSSTFWQYCGSCSMGSVVDNKLKVKGVQRLRVVDASAVPSLNSGEIIAAVVAFAEKAADLIKGDGQM